MSGPRILLADNNESYLNTCAEYIALAGYEVEKAHDPAGARRRIEEGGIHLAVLDMRLTNNDDEKDFSGLTLAKETSPTIPKIILTAYQTWEAVREALGTSESDVPPAVSFVAKQEGLAYLLMHVEQALAKFARLNWGLEIEWRGRDHLSLIRSMEPGLEGERLLRRGEEFEDLFRAHFREKNHVIVSRSLWQREGVTALVVFSFGASTTTEAHVVVCGRRAEVEEAARRQAQFGPHAPGASGTVLDRSSVTQHFAANSYALAGADLEQVMSLRDAYRTASERTLGQAMTGLLQQTLGEWHQGKRIASETLTLGEAYRRQLGLGGEDARAALDERVSFLVRGMPTIGLEAERGGGTLTLRFGGQVKTYTDPLLALGQSFMPGGSTLLSKTPGWLTGENVLVAHDGRTWLTDFSGADMLPVLWNYVTLEAAVRFDWAEANNVHWLQGLEQQLTGGDFSKLYVGDVEHSLRKVARTVALIRKLAARDVNKNYAAYHAGIMFHALARLAAFDPKTPLTMNEQVRLAHVLLAAAMIGDRLTRDSARPHAAAGGGNEGIRVDEEKGEVWINGERIPLRGQSYELLLDLYRHNNELRTRRALIEHLFQETYDESNESQMSRLNTAIRRLREKIEDDPDHPHFLLTEVNGGYRLVARPE
jgi:DNA-binding response OmpR family regulator